MNRRQFLGTLATSLLVAPLAAKAEQPVKVPQVGILFLNPLPPTVHLLEAIRQGLRERGYVEGQNIAIEFRSAEGRLDRLPDLANELVRLNVDLILTGLTPGIQAARQATSTIPIVMGISVDPVREGFVASLARPGGNITGLSLLSPEIAGKRLQLLKEVVPKISRVAILWNAEYTSSALLFRETEAAAPGVGVQLQSLELRGPNGFERAFQAATRGRAGGLIVVDDPLTFRHRTRIVGLEAKSRLPTMHIVREFAEAGALMAYGANIADMYRRSATYVDKILKGAKPADLPIEQPTKFELVINLKTAKALGLTIPQSLLLQADQVIE
jgi:putative tryptophan/tyrosine transport system substrate-binding protein